MRHTLRIPDYLPLPAIGSWFYASLFQFGDQHDSCGIVLRTGYNGYGENFIEYRNNWIPLFSNRPIK